MKPNELTKAIIGAAIEVHRELGPGLDEAAYESALDRELTLRGVPHQAQWALPVEYKGVKLDCGYRLDIIADDQVVVEMKSVDFVLPIHKAQLLTYLRLGGWHLGLLLNFNEALLRDGIERLVMDFEDEHLSTAEKQNRQRVKGGAPPAVLPLRIPFLGGAREINEFTEATIGAAIEVHKMMGPGLLRSAYEACLCYELSLRGIPFERKRPLRLRYKNRDLEQSTEIEIAVAGKLPVKILSVEAMRPVHEAQLLSQLKLGGWQFGLLFNFNVPILSKGIRRCANPNFIRKGSTA